MTITEENQMFKELAKTLPTIIHDVLKQVDGALDAIENVLTEGHCVLEKEKFEEALKYHRGLNNASAILISLFSEIGNLETEFNVLKVVSVTSTIKAIEKIFDDMHVLIDFYTAKIMAKEFNIDVHLLSERLKNFIEYDTINYDDIQTASDPHIAYMVLKMEDRFDRETNNLYGDFNVLRVASFTSKIDAFQYALANGISRDMILCKY